MARITSGIIPNDRFPIDLLLFREMGNKETAGLVESTYADYANLMLAWQGPFPLKGTVVAFTRPVPPAMVSKVSLYGKA